MTDLNTTLTTSTQILDAYIARSWRSNAERQRAKGADFVIGRREGIYMWNLEGTHRLIDCGTGGGVHTLGHRHPEVLAALRGALDDGRDTGLWTVPNLPYLMLQDRLTALSPSPELDRCVVTLASTVSVDVATMFAFRVTGRQKILAFRHGYHGHSGFAALVTGSPDEGVIDHYNLPTDLCAFFETYGDLDEIATKMTDDIAAIILEPMDYETFAFATQEFMDGLTALCRDRGVLLIIDETRTGIGRTGKLWASEHYNLRPDILITGKGLSGGLYPVSALLMKTSIYETCMNEHRFAYISSLGGNEIACVVGDKVLEVASRDKTLAATRAISDYLGGALQKLASSNTNHLGEVRAFGCVLAVDISDRETAKALYAALIRHGVMCHSICETEPPALKLFPPVILDEAGADEIAEAFRLALQDVASG